MRQHYTTGTNPYVNISEDSTAKIAELRIIDNIFQAHTNESAMNEFVKAKESTYEIYSNLRQLRRVTDEVFNPPSHFLEAGDFYWTHEELSQRALVLKTYGAIAGEAADKLYAGSESAIDEAWDRGMYIATAAAIASSSKMIWHELEELTRDALTPIVSALYYCIDQYHWRGGMAMKIEFVKDHLLQLAIHLLKGSSLEIVKKTLHVAYNEWNSETAMRKEEVIKACCDYLYSESFDHLGDRQYAYHAYAFHLAYSQIISEGVTTASETFMPAAIYHLKCNEIQSPETVSDEENELILGAIKEAQMIVTPGAIATVGAWQEAINRFAIDGDCII